MKPEYYKPGQIKYSESQILWLIRNVLFHDEWPSDHIESGYAGGKGHTVGHRASSEMIGMIIGELSYRLKQCGIAGWYLEHITLIDYADRDYLVARLAGYTGVTPSYVLFLANMALRFCKGNERKHVDFNYFCQYTQSNDNAWNKRRVK